MASFVVARLHCSLHVSIQAAAEYLLTHPAAAEGGEQGAAQGTGTDGAAPMAVEGAVEAKSLACQEYGVVCVCVDGALTPVQLRQTFPHRHGGAGSCRTHRAHGTSDPPADDCVACLLTAPSSKNFAESTEEIKPLTEEQKREQFLR